MTGPGLHRRVIALARGSSTVRAISGPDAPVWQP